MIRAGRRTGRGPLVTHLLADGATGTPRVGFVISKAVGNAVERNRLRRRLRHLTAERLDRLPAGSTLVVRALPGAAERSFSDLASALDSALAR